MDTISNRFIKMRKKLGFNKSQLSQFIQSTPSIIGEIESGKREPSKNILIKLLEIYGININWLLTGNGDIFINKNIDRYKNIEDSMKVKDVDETENFIRGSDFYGRYLLEDSQQSSEPDNTPKELDLIKIENVTPDILIKAREKAVLIPEILNIYKENLIAVYIKGDDMSPTINKNSIVLCDKFGFKGAGIYVVKIHDTYTVKRISIKPDSYIVSSDNKFYENYEVKIDDSQFKIIGSVRCLINIL